MNCTDCKHVNCGLRGMYYGDCINYEKIVAIPEWYVEEFEMKESCYNCGVMPCALWGSVTKCMSYKKIVAIPEWYADVVKSYGTDLLEEGYQQAMDDIQDWYTNCRGGIPEVECANNITRNFAYRLGEMLVDKKKERFYPELLKKCSDCRWAPKCEGDKDDDGENCTLWCYKPGLPIKPLEFSDGGRTRELLKQLQEMINKTFEDIIEMETPKDEEKCIRTKMTNVWYWDGCWLNAKCPYCGSWLKTDFVGTSQICTCGKEFGLDEKK